MSGKKSKKGIAADGEGKSVGGKWQSTEWDVSGEARATSNKQKDMSEPLMTRAEFLQSYNLGNAGADNDAFPAVYGVNLDERRRQRLLSQITKGNDEGLKKLLGERQVMLDDKTTSWLLSEQDRLELINIDRVFEESARAQGLFANPVTLQHLQKIRPDYFKRRRQLAKWVANAQLKMFDIQMNGIQSPEDFEFDYMLKSLDKDQKLLLQKPVWMLNEVAKGVKDEYQPGVFRQNRRPAENKNVAFAGIGSVSNKPAFTTALSGSSGVPAPDDIAGIFGNN